VGVLGLSNIFRASIYKAHRTVIIIFAVAQLSYRDCAWFCVFFLCIIV